MSRTRKVQRGQIGDESRIDRRITYGKGVKKRRFEAQKGKRLVQVTFGPFVRPTNRQEASQNANRIKLELKSVKSMILEWARTGGKTGYFDWIRRKYPGASGMLSEMTKNYISAHSEEFPNIPRWMTNGPDAYEQFLSRSKQGVRDKVKKITMK